MHRLRRALMIGVIGAAAAVLPSTAAADAPPGIGAPRLVAMPRIVSDDRRLFDSLTTRTFVPRGVNYVRLSQSSSGSIYHSTFEPRRYNGAAAGQALRSLRNDGYNVVRVFIDPGVTDRNTPHGIGRGPGTSGPVDKAYMDNVGDFVRRATNERIYVLPVLDAYPQNDLYFTIAAKAAVGADGNVAGENLWYLNPGYVAAKAEYMRRFASELKDRIGPAGMPTILAYSAQNEVFFEGDKAPYNSWSGAVTSLNGVRYDMADPAQRQESADASLVEYTRRLRHELVKADPAAMLTMGFFTNNAVGKAGFTGFRQPSTTRDFRFPGRPEAASRSGALDFLDMHVYPSSPGYRLVDDLRSSEAQQIRKPYVLGEFGAIRTVYGNDIRRAAFAMRDLQIASCRERAQGWLFWTWDTTEALAHQDGLFPLTYERGAINGQLAPIVRPNPCT